MLSINHNLFQSPNHCLDLKANVELWQCVTCSCLVQSVPLSPSTEWEVPVHCYKPKAIQLTKPVLKSSAVQCSKTGSQLWFSVSRRYRELCTSWRFIDVASSSGKRVLYCSRAVAGYRILWHQIGTGILI